MTQEKQAAAVQASGTSQAAQIAALQAQLAALQDAFVKQCGGPASNSSGRRLVGCRSVADDAPGAPPQSDKLPFIVGGAICGLALLRAVAFLAARRLEAKRRERKRRAGKRRRSGAVVRAASPPLARRRPILFLTTSPATSTTCVGPHARTQNEAA
jgi:hypothetical protein